MASHNLVIPAYPYHMDRIMPWHHLLLSFLCQALGQEANHSDSEGEESGSSADRNHKNGESCSSYYPESPGVILKGFPDDNIDVLSTESELYVPCFSVYLYYLFVDQHKERVLSSVENWEGVLADVDTLKSGSWMGQSCMNWYLLRHWLERKGTAKILQSLGFQRSGEIPRLPVTMFVHIQYHYFVAVFDYNMEHITLYGWFWNKEGHSYKKEENDPWHGCVMYKNVTKLFQFGEQRQEPRLEMLNWYQVEVHPCLFCPQYHILHHFDSCSLSWELKPSLLF